MDYKEAFVLVGCPLPMSFRVDARLVGMLESWRSQSVLTYYPSTGSPEIGYDKIVSFAQNLEPKPTHILFVDYDVLPRYTTLKKLLEHDKDVVCGVYPAFQKFVIKWCVSRDMDKGLMAYDDLPRNPFKAEVGANGMLLVKTEVFDKLEWPYWFTDCSEDKVRRGSDIYFFEKLRKAGFDIWVDPKIQCGHFKMVDLLGVAKTYILKGNKQ